MENAEIGSGERDTLIESLKQELGIIDIPSTNVSQRPMLQVPQQIKHANPDAYKPHLISIGPVHHGKPELQQMEDFKIKYARRYAHEFIQNNSNGIEKLIEVTEKSEIVLRNNYGITSQDKIPRDTFVKIMIRDAAFLVKFLLEEADPGPFNEKWNNVISDLFLLENQIPFHYLSELLAQISDMTVLELCDKFLDDIRPLNIGKLKDQSSRGEKHLLDRLRTRMATTTNGKAPEICKDLCPTISQLHRDGIEFRPTISSYELTFQQWILKIPQFGIDHNTGRYFANLVASELVTGDCYASDYIAVMDCLIHGPEDVRILVDSGILENYLEDDKAAASFINQIGKSINVSHDFHYKELVGRLKKHCKRISDSPWSRNSIAWMRELKINYCGSPWKILSVIGALILLALTLTQTVCSIRQLKK